MQSAVKERKQAEHATKLDRAVPARHAPQGRDAQRDAEKPQRPVSCTARDIAERIRAEVSGKDSPYQVAGWRQRGDEDDRFEDTPEELIGAHGRIEGRL